MGRCTVCGEEVYRFEPVYTFKSGYVHETCLLSYAQKFFAEDKKAAADTQYYT